MAESKHTPLPWKRDGFRIVGPEREHPQDRKLGIKTAPTRTVICHVACPSYEEQESNTELIYEAVNSYDQLKAENERFRNTLKEITKVTIEFLNVASVIGMDKKGELGEKMRQLHDLL